MSVVAALADALNHQNRKGLAQAITLVESTRSDHRLQAEELLSLLAKSETKSKAVRVGISGTPGVGKSTFIERFGLGIIDNGKRVAVLTVDPSSTLSGGSILGDKTRMERLSRHPQAFVRPSPSGLVPGGVGRRTREGILICEAAGFDVIIVETVGVGQSEVAVSQMTDVFLLLLQPGGGDGLQGIKRGIMELAEIVIVNKADGDLKDAATRAAAEYQNALSLLRRRIEQWPVPVRTCSSLTGEGVDDLWSLVLSHREIMIETGQWHKRRAEQAESWFWSETSDLLLNAFRSRPEIESRLQNLIVDVKAAKIPASVAARSVMDEFLTIDAPTLP